MKDISLKILNHFQILPSAIFFQPAFSLDTKEKWEIEELLLLKAVFSRAVLACPCPKTEMGSYTLLPCPKPMLHENGFDRRGKFKATKDPSTFFLRCHGGFKDPWPPASRTPPLKAGQPLKKTHTRTHKHTTTTTLMMRWWKHVKIITHPH